MKQFKYKKLVVQILLVFILLSSVTGGQATDLENNQKKLDEVKTELELQRTKLKQTREKEGNILQGLYISKRKLGRTNKRLLVTQKQLWQNENEVKQKVEELAEARDRLNQMKAKLSQRLVEIHKSSQVNYLEIIFAVESISQLLNQSFYFEKIIGQDVNLFNTLAAQENTIKQRKLSLERKTYEVRDLTELIKNEKTLVELQVEEQSRLHAKLREKRLEYERNVAELERISQQIEQMIKRLLTQQRQGKESAPQGTGVFIWPLKGRITSGFGYRRHPIFRVVRFHTGIDISAPYGTPIMAADSGKVIFADHWGGYGKAVIIDHGRGLSTVYAHLSRFYVQEKEEVTKRQSIGLVGSTGYSTGPHLHFEVRQEGGPVNPLNWLP